MDTRIVKNLDDLKSFAVDILHTYDTHRIFALFGPLGIGKTAFVKKVMEILETKDTVASPTFAIINEYFSEKAGKIYHFDLYRIKHVSEIYDLGYEDYLFNNNYCFIEWPELIEPLLPDKYVSLYFSLQQDGSRKISIKS